MVNFDIFTKDEDIVKKILIGSLLALTLIGFIPLAGWRLEHMRRTIEEDSPFLPEWDDFGKYISGGLKIIAFNLVWYLPIVLLVLLVSVFILVASGSFASGDDLALVIVALNFCVVGFTFLYVVPAGLLSVPAYGRLATTGSVREALSVRKAIQVFRLDPGKFVITGLLTYFMLSMLSSIGAILCLIGIYPASVAGYGLMGQMYGTVYKEAVGKLDKNN